MDNNSSAGKAAKRVGKVIAGIPPTVELYIAKVWSGRDHIPVKRLALSLATATGTAVTFGATLGAAQVAGACVGVSCATPVLGSLLGVAALCSASAVSAQVSYTLQRLCYPRAHKENDLFLSRQTLLFNVAFGLISYKVFGGRCRNLMPSNTIHPGALARVSIPARGFNYANEVELKAVRDIYLRYGCHHCGQRAGKCIADHMPPNMIAHGRGWAKSLAPMQTETFLQRIISTLSFRFNRPAVDQRLFPQCLDCMKLQSAALRHGKKSLVLHFSRGFPEPPYFTGFCIGSIRHVDD